ncbi:short transient receptor potential channel 4-like [Parasteatoda tepidariorum]|uniref:short transient receptor potential channel 4-like n=1 Tax=Parasteatoda tepidariorum TaxID=114398 RepID=UPI00077FA0D7|nr:short transient receptor potential channel 4-like [Parasteatoda tepidariorum]
MAENRMQSATSLLQKTSSFRTESVENTESSYAYHRMSFVDEILNPMDRRFLKLVERGDLEGLRTLFSSGKLPNLDSCDYRGRRALDIAVQARNLELIDYLLNDLDISNIQYYCGILSAVLEKDIYILDILLTRVSDNKILEGYLKCLVGGGQECIRCLPQVAASNLTPLMVASLDGNIEITKMFLERGYKVKKPHCPRCTCEKCCITRTNTVETLTESMSRLNTYRTLASPTYLILTSCDPILAAFQLSHELCLISCELPENQKEYMELSRQCSRFAADLLDECRTTEEVKTLINRKRGCPDKSYKLNRFVTAVHYNQKLFVTHPNCQQVLRSIWVEGLPWYNWTYKNRVLHVMKHALLMPVICLAYCFAPEYKKLKALDIPLNRFIYYTSSYCTFLFLLLLTLIFDRFDGSRQGMATEILVGLWIVGFFIDMLAKCWTGYRKGLGCWYKSYFYDAGMILLFVISEAIFVLKLSGVLSGSMNRKEMTGYDPVLVADAIYATASIMAYCRIIVWCKFSYHLGPLTVTLKHMIGDVVRFFILFQVVVIAFSIGINSLYKYYENTGECFKDGNHLHNGNEFQTLFQTGNKLFWAIFGKGEPHFADIYHCPKNDTGSELGIKIAENDHFFTEAVGYAMWGIYHFIACLVVLNMLIGMMAESYQRVQENADIEWKFGCSTLWLSVFDYNCLVPPPFNLLPSLRWFFIKYRRVSESKGKISYINIFNFSKQKLFHKNSEKEKLEQKLEEEKYEKLMIQLIRRYLHTNGLKDSAVASASSHRCCWKSQNDKKRNSKSPSEVNQHSN